MKAIIFALTAMMVFAAAPRSEEVIKEGDGWNRIQVNASGDEVAKSLKGQNYLIVIPNIVLAVRSTRTG